MTPLRVLIVDDSEADAARAISALGRDGRQVTCNRVESADALRAALVGDTWDAVICAGSMPGLRVPTARRVLHELELDIPFIVVADVVNEETAVEAMRAGARDYVLKDRLARLVPAIERELRESKERAARREAEAALRERERRLYATLDHLTEGYVLLGYDWRYLYVNETTARHGRLKREDFLGRTPMEVFPGFEDTNIYAVFRRCMEERSVAEVEEEFTLADGAKSWLEIKVQPVPEGLLVLSIDATERRKAIADLRTSEGHLRQAQKMEAVGRLAGGIAHDFNNVLSVILSYGELMRLELEPGNAMRGDVDEVIKAGKRAADLTRQLLMFSRQQVLEPKVLDLNEVLAGMDKMLRRLLGEDVEMISLPTQPLGRVRADLSSIEQVIMNLVVNARDAMPGGGRLTVETANVVLDENHVREHGGTKPGPHVMLAVTDTGVGMDETTRARIFEPFFMTKAKDKGTGLGLSTVFGIMEQSGGSIWVGSESGKGTAFKVYLPEIGGAAAGALRSLAPPVTLMGTETILLVEDEDPVRVVARNILRRHGYNVIEARNAGEALLICEKGCGVIHLLLSDVVMPQMSGPELAKRLVGIRPDMRVLCMSGYTDDNVVRHGVREAEVAFLQKPITPLTLARKVREVLDAPRSESLTLFLGPSQRESARPVSATSTPVEGPRADDPRDR